MSKQSKMARRLLKRRPLYAPKLLSYASELSAPEVKPKPKKKAGVYKDPEARRKYKREWMRAYRAKKAK